MMGPNFKKHVAHRMAQIAIPPGGGIGAGIAFLMDKHTMVKAAQDAQKWVNEAIDVVMTAPDNPYGNDREAIAAELVKRIDARRKTR